MAAAVVTGSAVECGDAIVEESREKAAPHLHAHMLDALEQRPGVNVTSQPALDLGWTEGEYEALDVGAFVASVARACEGT